MKAARYIYFTGDVPGMVAFYRDALGMMTVRQPKAMDYDPADWVQLKSGSFEVGIHRGSKAGCTGRNRNKLVLIVDDVAAERERLLARGIRMGKRHVGKHFESCDFRDPDGNVVQLSSR